MSGQIILVTFFHGYWIEHLPGRLVLYHGIIFLRSCLIATVLKRAFSREQNTRRDDEEENTGSGKSNILYEISGNRDQTPPWWVPFTV